MIDWPNELTQGARGAIERHARIGGGISRAEALLLLSHIDRLNDLLDIVMADGPSWDDEQWTVFCDAALPLVDMWSVRLRRKHR